MFNFIQNYIFYVPFDFFLFAYESVWVKLKFDLSVVQPSWVIWYQIHPPRRTEVVLFNP